MALARSIQMRMVPKAPPEVPLIDIQWKYEPALQVGGDLVQFITMADGRQGIFIADVAGKGMPAALVMTKVHEAAKLLSAWTDDLLDFMSRMNDSLVEDLETGSMVTASLVVFNPDGASIDMIRSGHCPTGIIRSAPGGLEWHEPKGLALGVDSPKWHDLHQVVRIDIGLNDGILLFTDGVNEAMNEEHQEFEFDRIKEFADRNASLDARQFVDGLFEEIRQFAGDAQQSDDITIVYGRKRGLSPIRKPFE
jgi:sigma-B regulation protein RsbU (phosphoserine phosphatase)